MSRKIESKSACSTEPCSPTSNQRITCLPRALESKLYDGGVDFVIGVDEAGRGPLAGSVVAAACVVLNRQRLIPGIHDSKQLDEETRDLLYSTLTSDSDVIWSVASVDNKRIDEINILQATFEAMTAAVEGVLEQLAKKTSRKFHVLIDGNKIPPQLRKYSCTPVIKGDGKEFLIAAASVLAKVTRDKQMYDLHEKFPAFNFAQHKGYPTAEHRLAISRFGPIECHRMTLPL